MLSKIGTGLCETYSKRVCMSKETGKSTVLDDGLRYKSKANGSLFHAVPYYGSATMSCYLCGKHRLRSELAFRKFIGKSQAVCSPKCSI